MKRPLQFPSRATGGFTIVELMVSVSILAIILTATTVIWSSQQKIMQIAEAQAEVSPYARALESNLRRDLQGLSRDGFMVISASGKFSAVAGEPAHDYYYDQCLFFSNSLKSAVNGGGQSLTSRIWYGHLMTSDWGNNAAAPDPTVVQWKLSLGRQDLLLAPGTAGAPASIAPADTSISSGTYDVVNTDMIAIKQTMFANATPPNPATAMANACFRITGQRYIDPTQVSSTTGIMPIHALMAPFCSSFRLQFAGRYNFHNPPQAGDTPAGQVDVNNNGQIIWYGTDDTGTIVEPASAVFPAGNSSVINPNTFVFSPDQPDSWPMLLQITVDLHDSNGRLHERFKKAYAANPTTTVLDGYQYRFIIKL